MWPTTGAILVTKNVLTRKVTDSVVYELRRVLIEENFAKKLLKQGININI